MSASDDRRDAKDADTMVIVRVFAAPRELVFDAWTKPEQLLAWFAPRDCTICFTRIDVRPGGGFHSCIHNPSFGDCWCVATYLEIVRPERIVYTIAIADSDGNPIDSAKAGHHPDWPEETIVSVTLEDEHGATKLTLRQNAPESLARQTGAYPGWLQMLDRLEEIVRPDAARRAG